MHASKNARKLVNVDARVLACVVSKQQQVHKYTGKMGATTKYGNFMSSYHMTVASFWVNLNWKNTLRSFKKRLKNKVIK